MSAQPHARFTTCQPCQKIVELLNEYIDRYNAAQDRADLAAQTALLADITSLGQALDACEKQCLSPAPLPGAVGPAPTPPPRYGLVPGAGTGFYAGLQAGGAFGRSQWNEPGEAPSLPDPSTNLFGLSGGLAGGFFGFQTQTGPWLFAAESDISGGAISGKTSVNCASPCRTSNHWLATVRGKAGYDLGGATPFVTGGLAVGDINANVGGFPGASTVQSGWTVGAGVQIPLVGLNLGLPDGVTGKFEWLHVDLGSPAVCTPKICGGPANVRFATDILRLGISIPLSGLLPR